MGRKMTRKQLREMTDRTAVRTVLGELKPRPTRYKELGYDEVATGCWRILDLSGSEPAPVGQQYRTRTELLADLERYATEFGCNGAPEESATAKALRLLVDAVQSLTEQSDENALDILERTRKEHGHLAMCLLDAQTALKNAKPGKSNE